MATFTPNVRVIVNGTPVDAATTNGPIADLTNRTAWLKDQLESLEAGSQLVLRDRSIDPGLSPGEPVYFNDTTGVYEGALSDVDQTNLERAASTTFWQGILSVASGSVGDIIIGGSLVLDQVTWASAFESGLFSTGDLFLSSASPGKLSTEPGTTAVYLGHMIDDGSGNGEMLVRLGSPGGYLDHVHLERLMLGKPAGSVVDPAMGDPQVITSPDAGQQGWLPANATYFPGFVVGVQIPVGAAFGYNLSHPNETQLNQIFPLVPPDNAQFSQSGLILGDSLIIANQYGLWWMDNSYGNAPWPVDYDATGVATDILVWTARLIASTAILDLVQQSIINELAAGEIDNLAVSSILSGDATSLSVVGTEGDATAGYQGQVTLTNTGVTALRLGRGLAAVAPLGNNVTGYRGLVDLEFDADLVARHLYTNVDPANASPTEKMSLLTTNGVSAGTTLAAYGHRLGGQPADFIDFLVAAGSDLKAATDYQVSVTLQGCVDTVAGAPTAGEVNVSFYRLTTGQPVSTSQLQRTSQATFQTGLPGQLQTAALGPYADVLVQNNDQLLVRISLSTGTPLPVDTFRLLNLYYRMDEV